MAYVRYEKDDHALWKCEDEVSDPFSTYDDAVKACDKNPSCKYIENEDCSSTEGFQPCTSLVKDGKSCAFEKEGAMISKTTTSVYVTYEKDNHTKWNCPKENIGYFSSYGDAINACDEDPSCKYIENEDCSGTEGFELCTLLEKNRKSCAFEKTANTGIVEKTQKHTFSHYFQDIVYGVKYIIDSNNLRLILFQKMMVLHYIQRVIQFSK